MKNKILLVIDNLGSGGAQNQLTILARELKSHKYKVHFFTYYPQDFFKERLTKARICLHHVPKRDRLGLNVIVGLKKIIEKEKIDVVISYLNTPNFYTAVTKALSNQKFKLLISYRSMTDFDQIGMFRLNVLKWINNRADKIITNSHHERKRWQAKYPKIAYKWETIYNAIDTSKFFRKENIPRKNYFLVVGSIRRQKNGLLVLKALRRLKEEHIKTKIIWIGRKDYHLLSSKDYIDKMESQIDSYELQNFFYWQSPIKDIEKYYNECRALILASEIEGLPNVVCEAICCGTPIVVSDVLDHPRLVKHNQTGLLFNPKKDEDLADAMKNIIQMQESKYKNMCREALTISKELFDNSKFITAYIKIMSVSPLENLEIHLKDLGKT